MEPIGTLGGPSIASPASLIALTPTPVLDQHLHNLDAVLVSQEEVEEKNASLGEMRSKTEQMKSDMDYSLHRKDTEWSEQLKLQKDEFEVMLTAERTRYEELQLRHEQHVREQMVEDERHESDHVQVTQVWSCLALPCLALPCLALPCLALLCLAVPCLALSYVILLCLMLHFVSCLM